MDKKDNYEVAQLIKEDIDGVVGELKVLLEPPMLPPEYSDAEVKQAIIELTPEAHQRLFQRFGQEFLEFVSSFSEGRLF